MTTGATTGSSAGPLRAAVVVASNRAADGVYEDEAGPILVDFLRHFQLQPH